MISIGADIGNINLRNELKAKFQVDRKRWSVVKNALVKINKQIPPKTELASVIKSIISSRILSESIVSDQVYKLGRFVEDNELLIDELNPESYTANPSSFMVEEWFSIISTIRNRPPFLMDIRAVDGYGITEIKNYLMEYLTGASSIMESYRNDENRLVVMLRELSPVLGDGVDIKTVKIKDIDAEAVAKNDGKLSSLLLRLIGLVESEGGDRETLYNGILSVLDTKALLECHVDLERLKGYDGTTVVESNEAYCSAVNDIKRYLDRFRICRNVVDRTEKVIRAMNDLSEL